MLSLFFTSQKSYFNGIIKKGGFMIFEKKFVYSKWDDALTDKICYVANNTYDLKRAVEEEIPFFKQKVKKGKDGKIYINLGYCNEEVIAYFPHEEKNEYKYLSNYIKLLPQKKEVIDFICEKFLDSISLENLKEESYFESLINFINDEDFCKKFEAHKNFDKTIYLVVDYAVANSLDNSKIKKLIDDITNLKETVKTISNFVIKNVCYHKEIPEVFYSTEICAPSYLIKVEYYPEKDCYNWGIYNPSTSVET